MSTTDERPHARYRFDPHTAGIFLGLGQVRTGALLAVLGVGVALMYRGDALLGLLLLLVGPVFVIWAREGIPMVLWLPLRLSYRLTSHRRRGWSLDPELVPHVDPLGERVDVNPLSLTEEI